MLNDRVALAILAFVAVLEALNVGHAIFTNGQTLPAVDLLFTTTGGAVLTDSLSRRRKDRDPGAGAGGGTGSP